MSSSKLLRISPLALAAAQLFCVAANAADASLPVIEVVGNTPLSGGTTALTDASSNVQVIKFKSIHDQGSSNVADTLNANLGSVSVSNGSGNPYQNDVNYRGFQATSLLGAPVSLSVYFDGVRMNEAFGSIVNWDLIPMNAISEIEVMPGSNPLFGLNTLGGAVVVNTKNGQDNEGATLNVLGGSFHRRAVSLETGWNDKEAGSDVFLAANLDAQDGYRQHTNTRVGQVYGKARWHDEVTGRRLELSMAYANTDLKGTQSLPMDMMSNIQSAYTWPDKTSNQMGLLNLKGSQQLNERNSLTGNLHYKKSNSSVINSNAQLDDGCFDANGNLLTISGTNNYKCGNMAPNGTAVNSVTGANALALGYGRWTSSINTSLVDSTTTQKTVGMGLEWTNNDDLAGMKNAFSLGGLVDHSSIDYGQSTYLAKLVNYQAVMIQNHEYGFTANGLAPSATNLPQFTGSNVLNGVNLNSTTKDFSIFLTDTLSVTDKLKLTGSGSYNYTSLDQLGANSQYLNSDGGYNWTDSVTGVSYYNPSYLSAFKYSNSGTGAATTHNAVAGIAGPETNSLNGNHQYRRFNPSVGFNLKANSNTAIFGNYSESMRTPTSVELSCANPLSPCALPTGFNGDPDLKAVVAKTIELGARGKVGERTSWNAAVYDSRLSNDIQFIATSNTYGYFANVGNTERRGFELGAQTRWDAFSLSGNYGYVNAVYKSPFTTAGGESVVSGNKIPGIPSNSFKVRTTYSPHQDWLLGLNMMVVGDQFTHGNESNTDPNGKVAGYTLVNLDLHYNITSDLKLALNVNNLFNKQYATYGISGLTSVYSLATQNFLTPAAPRAAFVGLSYQFGSGMP